MVFYEYDNITYGDIMRKSIWLSKTYPHIITLKSIGFSHDGREITAIYLGKQRKNKTVLFTAGVHGREAINPAVFLMTIEDYCKRYENDFEVRMLIENLTMIFVPVVNPDGYEVAKNGFKALQNSLLRNYCRTFGIKHYLWKYNGRGVDINRNFTSKSFSPTENMPYSSSENETKALENLMVNEAPVGYMDFHSRGRVIYWYRNNMPEEYNKKQYDIAVSIADICGYEMMEPEFEMDEKGNGGNTVHFSSEKLLIPSFTIETINDFADFPLDINYYELVYRTVKEVPLKFALLMQNN